MKYILAFVLGITLFYSCRYIGGKRVRGEGNVTSDQRNLPSFREVNSYGSFDVTLTTGDQHSVKVEAEQNLQQYIETEIEGSTLVIRTRRGYNLRPNHDIKIHVTAPSYRSLSSYGSGNMYSEGLITSADPVSLEIAGSGNINAEVDAPSLSAEISGSGNMLLSGTVKNFSSSIRGSGSIKAADMKSDEGKVEIAGSGNVEITANNKLDVRIMGSGDVRYRGNAQINSSIAGSGSVNRIN